MLQQNYIARLKRENHLRHTANNDTELQNIVLRLRDDLGELRKKWEDWLEKDEDFKARTTSQLEEIAESARLTTEKIRAHLLQTAEETHRASWPRLTRSRIGRNASACVSRPTTPTLRG